MATFDWIKQMLQALSPIYGSQAELTKWYQRERDFIQATYDAGGMSDDDFEQELTILKEQHLHSIGKFF